MNQPSNHPNQTQTGSSFPSQQSSQTNPFTADLKGEFTSNFGTNTNAVSQIFKDGGFASDNSKKYMLIGVAVIFVLVIAFLFLGESEPEQDPIFGAGTEIPATDPNAVDPTAADPNAADPNAATALDPAADPNAMDPNAVDPNAVDPNTAAADPNMADPNAAMQQQTQDYVDQAPAADTYADAAPTYASGGPALVTPVDGDSRTYDETQGPATFSWEGGGGTVQFARNRSMSPLYMSVPTSGSSYAFYNPYPGTWYWRVVQGGAASEVRSFYVEPAVPRNIVLNPVESVAGEGGLISWSGDSMVAFYRVELSADGNWAAPAYRFASASEGVTTTGVAPGAYQMRVGAFSETAGRWEYTQPVSVNVQ